MVARCSRTQCGLPAVVCVTFDSMRCFVWIDPFDDDARPDAGARGAGVLCARHADALVLPRGWAVQDRRGREPRLWSDRPAKPLSALRSGTEPALRSGTEPVRRSGTEPVRRSGTEPVRTRRPELAVVDAASEDQHFGVAFRDQHLPFDETAPVVAEPAISAASDIDRMLDAPSSPLLSRAFNAAHTRQAG